MPGNSQRHKALKPPSGRSNLTCLLLAITVAVLSVLSYYAILDYDFTGTDAIPLIMTSRIQSFYALKTILTSRLLGTYLEEAYYRPISNLSYGLDYAIWDLGPFGYHLTDLVLHTLNSILVFVFVRNLDDKRDVWVAWLSASIFAIHPIHVETVPVISRRPDLLSTFFLVLSLIFWQMSCDSQPPKRWLYSISSLLLSAMAMGSKDSAIVLPLLFFAYIAVFSTKKCCTIIRGRIFSSARRASPFFMLLAGYLSLRILVLGGIGGPIRQSSTLLSRLKTMLLVSFRFFEALIYPVDFLNLYSHLSLPLISGSLQARILGFIATGVIAILGLCLVQCVRHFLFLADRDTGNHHWRRSLEPYFFFFCWLFLYWSLYVLSEQFVYWYSYTSVIAFSALVSFGLRDLWANRGKAKGKPLLPVIQSPLVILSITILLGLIVSLLIFSPLLREYAEWETASFISSKVLKATAECVRELPNDATLYLINYPRRIMGNPQKPHVRQCAILRDYSVEAWIKLQFPEKNRIKAVSLSYLGLVASPSELESYLEFSERKKITITILRGGEMWLTGKDMAAKPQDRVIEQFFMIGGEASGGSKKLVVQLSEGRESTPNQYVLIYDYSDGGRVWVFSQVCSAYSKS